MNDALQYPFPSTCVVCHRSWVLAASEALTPAAANACHVQDVHYLGLIHAAPNSQVAAIRRLHRGVQSSLVSPCSVVLSLPTHPYCTGPSSAGCGSNSGSRDPRLAGDSAAFTYSCHQDTEEGQKRWDGGEGSTAALRLEVRTRKATLDVT